MEITPVSYAIKCDIAGCANNAHHKLNLKKSFFSSGTHICEECLKNIYQYVAKSVTPKSVSNPLKTPKKINKG